MSQLQYTSFFYREASVRFLDSIGKPHEHYCRKELEEARVAYEQAIADEHCRKDEYYFPNWDQTLLIVDDKLWSYDGKPRVRSTPHNEQDEEHLMDDLHSGDLEDIAEIHRYFLLLTGRRGIIDASGCMG